MSLRWLSLLVALTSLGCARDPKPERSEQAPAASSSQAQTIAPSAAAPGLPAVALGERRVYSVTSGSEARMGEQLLTQFDLGATLRLTVLEQSATGVLFVAELQEPKLGSKHPELAAEFGEAAKPLATPFFFKLAPGGTIAEVYFDPSASTLTMGIARSLVAALQGPTEPVTAKVVRRELDATGAYEIEYAPSAEPGHVTRSKRRYVDTAVQSPSAARMPMAPQAGIEASSGEAWLSRAGLVERSEGQERVRMEIGATEQISVATRLSLRQLRLERASAAELGQARELRLRAKRRDGAAAFDEIKESPALDQARIDGRTLPQVLAALRDHEALARPAERDAQAAHDRKGRDHYAALEALVRVDPNVAPELAKRIRAKDKLSVLLIDALGSSGSPRGHETLHALLRERALDATNAKMAAIALSRTPRPSEASIAALRALLADPALGTQAVLGIGTTVRRLGERGDEAQATQLLGLILGRLEATQDIVEDVALLRAIANSGNAQAFSKVVPFLSRPEPELRVAALEALRLMQHPEVDARLADAMRGDERAKVRIEAIEAARLRAPSETLSAAVAEAGQSDKDAHVRQAAVRTLSNWLRPRPELAKVLSQVAAKETVEQIKKQALAALETK